MGLAKSTPAKRQPPAGFQGTNWIIWRAHVTRWKSGHRRSGFRGLRWHSGGGTGSQPFYTGMVLQP